MTNSVSFVSPENVFISPPTRYKEKNSNFTVDKLFRHYLTKRAELTSPITRHTAHHLSGILAKIAYPHFNLEKISDKLKLRDILQKTDQYCSRVSRSWKLKSYYRSVETWQLNAIRNPGLDSGPEKWPYGTTGKIWIRVYRLVNSIVSLFISLFDDYTMFI